LVTKAARGHRRRIEFRRAGVVLKRTIVTSQRDAIGQRGELIARFALTQFHDGEPIFKHAFLGDKWEAADLFVQVRTTSDLPDANGRVSLTIKREELGALAAYPAPRYLLIVTERDGRVYIRPVETEGPGLSQIRCEHALTVSNCLTLRDDVRRYWSEHPARPWTSMFSTAPRES
jgi:hypothetical protein